MYVRTKNIQPSFFFEQRWFYVCTWQRYKNLNEVAMNSQFFLSTANCTCLSHVLASLLNKSSENYCAYLYSFINQTLSLESNT